MQFCTAAAVCHYRLLFVQQIIKKSTRIIYYRNYTWTCVVLVLLWTTNSQHKQIFSAETRLSASLVNESKDYYTSSWTHTVQLMTAVVTFSYSKFFIYRTGTRQTSLSITDAEWWKRPPTGNHLQHKHVRWKGLFVRLQVKASFFISITSLKLNKTKEWRPVLFITILKQTTKDYL